MALQHYDGYLGYNYYLTNQPGLVIMIIIVLWNRSLKKYNTLYTASYICYIIKYITNFQFVLGQQEQLGQLGQQGQQGQLGQVEESRRGTARKQRKMNEIQHGCGEMRDLNGFYGAVGK